RMHARWPALATMTFVVALAACTRDAKTDTTHAALDGSVSFGPIGPIGPFPLPVTYTGPLGRIEVSGSVSCWASGTLAYSATQTDRLSWAVAIQPTISAWCTAEASAYRYAIIQRRSRQIASAAADIQASLPL